MSLARESALGDIGIVFVHQGSRENSERISSTFHEGAEGRDARLSVIEDRNRALFEAFGLERGGLGSLFGWATIKRGLAAWSAGHRVSAPKGQDVRVLPAAFVVESDSSECSIVAEHRYANAGDHPDLTALANEA